MGRLRRKRSGTLGRNGPNRAPCRRWRGRDRRCAPGRHGRRGCRVGSRPRSLDRLAGERWARCVPDAGPGECGSAFGRARFPEEASNSAHDVHRVGRPGSHTCPPSEPRRATHPLQRRTSRDPFGGTGTGAVGSCACGRAPDRHRWADACRRRGLGDADARLVRRPQGCAHRRRPGTSRSALLRTTAAASTPSATCARMASTSDPGVTRQYVVRSTAVANGPGQSITVDGPGPCRSSELSTPNRACPRITRADARQAAGPRHRARPVVPRPRSWRRTRPRASGQQSGALRNQRETGGLTWKTCRRRSCGLHRHSAHPSASRSSSRPTRTLGSIPNTRLTSCWDSES
ncbi:hypothetical protein ABIA38_003304 [Embleya sp. AB8]